MAEQFTHICRIASPNITIPHQATAEWITFEAENIFMISSFCLIKGTPNSAMCYGEIFQNELLEVTKTKRENEYHNQNQKKG
ncbi:MAG: hypothetical protein MJY47_08175 [Fibrobacter sp.]|nr:hypothetical protein [Fibrobacter sp.]